MTTQAARIDALEAKLDKLIDLFVASGAPAVSEPVEAATAAEPVLVAAPKGKRMSATRAHNLATHAPKRHCPKCKLGFVFDKDACPKCGKAL